MNFMFAAWCFWSQRPEVHSCLYITSWNVIYFGLSFQSFEYKISKFRYGNVTDIVKAIVKNTVIKDVVCQDVCASHGTGRKQKSGEWWREISMNNLFCVTGGCFKCISRFFTQWVNWKKLESISTQSASSKNAWIFLEQIIILFWAF